MSTDRNTTHISLYVNKSNKETYEWILEQCKSRNMNFHEYVFGILNRHRKAKKRQSLRKTGSK